MDVFKHTEALGIPLEIILMKLEEKNVVVDWVDFCQSAIEHGWNQKTIIDKIRYNVVDVYGRKYCDSIIERLELIFALKV